MEVSYERFTHGAQESFTESLDLILQKAQKYHNQTQGIAAAAAIIKMQRVESLMADPTIKQHAIEFLEVLKELEKKNASEGKQCRAVRKMWKQKYDEIIFSTEKPCSLKEWLALNAILEPTRIHPILAGYLLAQSLFEQNE